MQNLNCTIWVPRIWRPYTKHVRWKLMAQKEHHNGISYMSSQDPGLCILKYYLGTYLSVLSYKLRYIVGFGLVKMAISTNPKPTIYTVTCTRTWASAVYLTWKKWTRRTNLCHSTHASNLRIVNTGDFTKDPTKDTLGFTGTDPALGLQPAPEHKSVVPICEAIPRPIDHFCRWFWRARCEGLERDPLTPRDPNEIKHQIEAHSPQVQDDWESPRFQWQPI